MSAGSWGERLRERAKSLGLSDTEVARRIGLTQRRYSSYVNMTREPNFEDLLRICAGLSVTPDWVLGVSERDEHDDAVRRAGAALARMSSEQRALALGALEGMAEVVRKVSGGPGSRRQQRAAAGS